MPRKPINNNETIETIREDQTPVESGVEQSNTGRNIILGALAIGAVVGGLYLYGNRDNGEMISPIPSPTPTVEVAPSTAPASGTDNSGTSMPQLAPLPEGDCWNMTKGGQFFQDKLTQDNVEFCIVPTPVATSSAAPRK